MRVLLVDPPLYRFVDFRNYGFPVGLGYLAAVLHQQGHEVKIYDADCHSHGNYTNYDFLTSFYARYLNGLKQPDHPIWKEVEATLRAFNPDVVGVTVMTPKFASAMKVAEVSKRVYPEVPVLFGGPHATLKSDEILAVCNHVDVVMEGEGFLTLPKLLEKLKKNNFPSTSVVAASEFVEDLDTLPFPEREALINLNGYAHDELGLLITSIGCPANCTFCATKKLWPRGLRSRSPRNILDEIKQIKETYGVQNITILDDTFTIPKSRVRELCTRILEEKLSISWTCATRANAIDKPLIRLMKEAGCIKVSIGVESGSENILKTIQKGVTKKRIREAACLLNESKMLWTGFFLMGLPHEKKEDTLETLRFLKELNPPFASLGVYENFPGTKNFEDGISLGITKEKMKRDDFFNTPPHLYYFVDPRRRVATMSGEDYLVLVHKMLKEFHRHNHSIRALIRRAVRKRDAYLRNPRMFFSDLATLKGKFKVRKMIPKRETSPN